MERKKFCTNCGTPAALEALFCMNCGTKFPQPEPMQQEVPAAEPAPAPMPEAAPVQPDLEATVSVVGATTVLTDNQPPMQQEVPTAEPAPAPMPEAVTVQPDLEATVSVVGATTVLTNNQPPMQQEAPTVEPAPAPMPEAAPVQPDLEATVSVVGATTVLTNNQPPIQQEVPANEPLAPIYEPAVNTEHQPNGWDPRNVNGAQYQQPGFGQPYVQQNPYVQPTAVNKMPGAKKKITAGSVITTVISVLLAIIMIVPVVVGGIVGAIGAQISDDSIRDAVNSIEVYRIIEDSLFNEYRHPDGKHTGFAAYMYNMIYPNDTEIDDEEYADFTKKLELILNSDGYEATETVREFVSDKLTDVMDDVRNNTSAAKITPDEVGRLIDDIRGDLEKEFNFTVSDEDIEMVKAEVEKSNIDKLTIKSIKKGNEELFGILSFSLSGTAFFVFIGIGALLLVLTIAVKGKHVQTGMIIGSISLALSGGAVYGLSQILDAVFDGRIMNDELIRMDIVRRILENRAAFTASAENYLTVFGLAVLGAASVLFVIGVIIAIVKGVKNKRA